jgi:hypothetical protein
MGGALVVAAGIVYRRGGSDANMQIVVKELAKDFSEMKDEMKAFSKAVSDLAVQRAEINLLMKWYDELRRGIGIVKDSQ